MTSEIELLEQIAQEVEAIRFFAACGLVFFAGAIVAGIGLTIWYLILETRD